MNNMNNRMSRYYYSAANADGSICTSRFGADTDTAALTQARKLLGGGPLPAGVVLYRHIDGSRTQYEPVLDGLLAAYGKPFGWGRLITDNARAVIAKARGDA